MIDVLARARAYRDAYRIGRRRQTESLADVLRGRYVFDLAEDGYDEELIDDVAEAMRAHPSVVSVDADYSDGQGYAIARDLAGFWIATVDVEQDGTMRLRLPS